MGSEMCIRDRGSDGPGLLGSFSRAADVVVVEPSGEISERVSISLLDSLGQDVASQARDFVWTGEEMWLVLPESSVAVTTSTTPNMLWFYRVDTTGTVTSSVPLEGTHCVGCVHSSVSAEREGRLIVASRQSPPAFSTCLLYTSPSPRDATLSRMPSSA